MKLSVATLALTLASVGAANLRVQKAVAHMNDNDNDNDSNYARVLGSEVILKGTNGEPTPEDMEFIGKALVASYNDVHWEVGHYMTGAHAVDFKGPDSILCRHCPDDDSMGGFAASSTNVFEIQTPVGILCRHCPDDDAMGALNDSVLLTEISSDCAGLCKKEATDELEVNFCNRIRSARGSDYLSSAKACAIRFDSQDEDETNRGENHHHFGQNTFAAFLDSTIILKGVGAGETTKEEQAILAKAFVSAYNDVHWSANHFLDNAAITFSASTPAPDGILCRHCPDDDAMGGRAVAVAVPSNTLTVDILTPVSAILCRHCPDDDAMGGGEFDSQVLSSNGFDKKAVEVAFCRKIQNSISSKLASAETCTLAVETVL